jgi:hypothetical protein
MCCRTKSNGRWTNYEIYVASLKVPKQILCVAWLIETILGIRSAFFYAPLDYPRVDWHFLFIIVSFMNGLDPKGATLFLGGNGSGIGLC